MPNRILALSLLVLCGCAAQPPVETVREFAHKGFTLRLSEPGWTVVNRQRDRLDLAKRGAHADESYAIHVFTFSLPPLRSGADLTGYLAARRGADAQLDADRYRVLARREDTRQVGGSNCLRLQEKLQDSQAQSRGGAPAGKLVESVTVVCPHPLNQYLAIDATYLHRHHGHADAKLLDKMDALWRGIEFNRD